MALRPIGIITYIVISIGYFFGVLLVEDGFKLLSFQGKYRILHLTWFAFFITYVIWLSLGPMMPFIQEALGLTDQQAKVLLILNVAMTIPARIVVGMLVDKLGPKALFSSILILGGLVSIAFSWMSSYDQLAWMDLGNQDHFHPQSFA